MTQGRLRETEDARGTQKCDRDRETAVRSLNCGDRYEQPEKYRTNERGREQI